MFPFQLVAWIIMASVLFWTGSPLVAETPSPPAGQKAAELMPFANLFPPDQMRQGFIWRQITPFGDQKFYFELLAPKDWGGRPISVTRQQLAEDNQAPVPMAQLTPNNQKENATIQVAYMRVPQNVTLERFVNAYAEQSGFTMVARQRGEFGKRQVEEALLKMTSKEVGPMLTRFTASRRGEFIFVVASSSPEAQYEKYKRIFGVAAVSFDPSGK